MPSVWKNFGGCTILITLGHYYEIDRRNGYMNFRELIGCKRKWRITSRQEIERDCSWILHTEGTK
jgi:hypothetical protein